MYDLVSIIVPIYNTAEYLCKCIDSLIAQTYKNIEIILVDDGSTDNSYKICQSYLSRDIRIHLFQQDNQGLSAARNMGIKQLSDESIYLTFVDSDDYVDRNYIEEMVKLSIQYDADIVSCKYISFDEQADYIEKLNLKEKVFINNGLTKFEGLFNKQKVDTVISCCKLFRNNIFKEIRYPIGKLHEDEYVIHDILNVANKIVYTNLPYYYYFQRANSITQSTFNIKRLDIIEALTNRINFFNLYKEKNYIKAVYSDFFKRLPYFYYETKKIDQNRASEIMAMYQNMLKENQKKINGISRIRYSLFAYLPQAYYYILKILRRPL